MDSRLITAVIVVVAVPAVLIGYILGVEQLLKFVPLRHQPRARPWLWLLPALALLFGTPLNVALVAAVLLATVGMAALGCLFAAMVARVRAREVLLPLLTLPLWIPFIIAGGQAVQVAMGASGSYNQAVALLIDFDILFVVLTSLAARFVLDD